MVCKDEYFDRVGPYRTQPLWTNSMDERENLDIFVREHGFRMDADAVLALLEIDRAVVK